MRRGSLPYVLNLFDLLCTLTAVRFGAVELNPISRAMLYYPFVYPVYKILVTGVLLLWLSKRPERIAVWGIRLCTAFYSVIALQHIVGMTILL